MNTQFIQQSALTSSIRDIQPTDQQSFNPLLKSQKQEQLYTSITSPNFIPILKQNLSTSSRGSNIILEERNLTMPHINQTNKIIGQTIPEQKNNSREDKQPHSEPKLSNYELLASQYRKNQVRQFTLGNDFEQTANFIQISNRQSINNTMASQDQLLGSVNNMNNTSESQNNVHYHRGSLTSMLNVNGEGEQMKQIIQELMQRITRLEERVESNEEKIELNDRLNKLKDQQFESAQLAQLSSTIKIDVEKYVESVIVQQQQECDRTIDLMKKIEIFEKRLKSSEDNYMKFVSEMENQFKEALSHQNALIDRAMKLTNSNSSQIEKNFEKYGEFHSKITEINEKVKLLQQNITLSKDETLESLKQYETSLEQITKVQNNITEDLKSNVAPSIKGLEDDFFRMLQNYKEISDSIHISKYLDEEVVLLKHRIKVISQKININESWQVNNASLITTSYFKS